MQKIAIIDLGTNTFNLLIAEIENSDYKIICNTKLPVKLGESSIDKNIISDAAIERAINTLLSYKKILNKNQVINTFCFATSAIRSAKNKKAFCSKILENTGFKIDVISGDKEANYIYEGVKLALRFNDKPVLIMDIGGGSTEFIIANKNKILWKHSYNLGIARIIAKFKTSDPLKKLEINQIENHFDKELTELFSAFETFKPFKLVGSSGSFDTFAEMIAHQFYAPDMIENKTSYIFKMKDYKAIHQELLNSTLSERLKIKGLISMRADMIVIASIFANYILKKFNLKKLQLSTYALKEGILSEYIKK